MKAGRELDALIAEKVMEHKVIRKGEEFTGFPLLLHSSGDWETGIAKEDIWQIGERSYSPFSLPHYSTQIADADLLLDKLVEMWHCPALIYDDDGQWGVAFDGIQNIRGTDDLCTTFLIDANMFADTAPLAICLAALEAVKVT